MSYPLYTDSEKTYIKSGSNENEVTKAYNSSVRRKFDMFKRRMKYIEF